MIPMRNVCEFSQQYMTFPIQFPTFQMMAFHQWQHQHHSIQGGMLIILQTSIIIPQKKFSTIGKHRRLSQISQTPRHLLAQKHLLRDQNPQALLFYPAVPESPHRPLSTTCRSVIIVQALRECAVRIYLRLDRHLRGHHHPDLERALVQTMHS